MAENVTIRFDADGIRRTLRRMESVRDKLDDMGITGERLRSVLRGVRTVAIGLGAALGATGVAMGVLIREATQAGSALEQTGIRLDSIMGSAEAGQESLEGLTEAAAQLPFTFEEITRVAPTLGVISDSAAQLQTRLFQAAEISARFGISLQETAGNMVRFFTAGANSADLFRERGVLQALGVVAGEETTLEESKALWRQFFSDIERSGSSALGRLAASFEGRLSMVQDAWFRLMGNIAESGVMDAVKQSLTVLREEMQRFMDSGAAEDFAVIFTNALASMAGAVQGLVNALAEANSFIRDTPIIRGIMGRVLGIDLERTARGQVAQAEGRLQELRRFRERVKETDFTDQNLLAGRRVAGVVRDARDLGLIAPPDVGFEGEQIRESLLAQLDDAVARHQDRVDALVDEADRTANVLGRFNDAVDRVQAVLRGDAQPTAPSIPTPRLTQMVGNIPLSELIGLPTFQTTAAQEMMLAPAGGIGGMRTRPGVGRLDTRIIDDVQRRMEQMRAGIGQEMEGIVGSSTDGFSTIADVAVTSMGQAVQAAITGFDNIAQIVLNSVQQIIQSLGRQGGPLAGLLGGVGIPLIGAGLGIIGALVSGGSDRPQPVEIKNSDPIPVEEQRDRGPDSVIIRLIAPESGEVIADGLYEMNRLERRDATPRIPEGANLALGGIG